METTLKQRLIGAAVIIALAVIFVPMILDGSGRKESVALNMEVPPEPTFTFDSKLPDPKQLDDLPAIKKSDAIADSKDSGQPDTVQDNEVVDDQNKSEAPVVQQENIPTNVQAKVEPKVVEATENHIQTNPALSAWAIQVAAFGEKSKALALQEKLLTSNLSAFTERSVNGDKAVYRVKVGPELKRENADKLRDKIEKEHGLKGSFVIKHP